MGAQRDHSLVRAKKIAKYINTVESAFPNSIIIAANYINHGDFQDEEEVRWRIEGSDKTSFHLHIPTTDKMASIIDGQHRLLGFDFCDPARKDMDLLCAVYMDLPQPYQAYLFATININQRKVDKSLAYDQFGYNLDTEDPDSWAPDKLAVFLTRKLNLDPSSPLYNRIRIAPLNKEAVFDESEDRDWQVSTACIVEGIAKLISSNAKNDRNELHKWAVVARTRSHLKPDYSPLRELYLKCKDDEITKVLRTYFEGVDKKLWTNAKGNSYIRRTIGVQALFDILGLLIEDESLPEDKLKQLLAKSSKIDFSDPLFQASGKGRTRVRNAILLAADMMNIEEIVGPDKNLYRDLLIKSGLL